MHVDFSKPFNVHYIILKEVENNIDIRWITKAGLAIKLNRLKNVLTHYKLIKYLPSLVSNHL